MLSEKLIAELHELSLVEKLRVVQLLVNDLAASTDAHLLLSNTQYEVWSPYDSAGAAADLMDMLEESTRHASDT